LLALPQKRGGGQLGGDGERGKKKKPKRFVRATRRSTAVYEVFRGRAGGMVTEKKGSDLPPHNKLAVKGAFKEGES